MVEIRFVDFHPAGSFGPWSGYVQPRRVGWAALRFSPPSNLPGLQNR
jgi:hypothetical protein